MQNIIEKNSALTILDIEKFYEPKAAALSIGLEYERLSLDKTTLKNQKQDVISKIVEEFSLALNWELVYDEKNIIGAKDNNGTSISLEPGGQLELSLKPYQNIKDIECFAKPILDELDNIGKKHNTIFLGYGISPISRAQDIELLKKRRYEIMNKYLPYQKEGSLCPRMMRETAGIQVNIDYFNKTDCFLKLKFFNLIMPIITALCANSEEGDYKTIRSFIWRKTGQDRCNLFYKNIFKKSPKNVFQNYIEEILNVPILYIERNSEYIPIMGRINFRDFMKYDYLGYSAQYDDYINHQSLCFPDIRLKNYIEIRNHDSNDFAVALALCALYKGLCQYDMRELLQKFSYLKLDKIPKYYEKIEKKALFGNLDFWHKTKNIVREILVLSKKKLSSDERKYLKPLEEKLKRA